MPPPGRRTSYLAWTVLVLAIAVSVWVRLRLLNFPLERDEGEYAYAGQLILEGIPPYQLVYNMKMPGTYLGYAAIMALCGQTPAGIHLGLIVVHLASLGVLFLLARKFLGLSGAAIATSAYALMTLSPSFLGLAAHATHFVLLPALLGSWMLLRFERTRRWIDCFASGCFFGIAFLMKQPGLLFGIFGGLYLTWLCVQERFFPASANAPTLTKLTWRDWVLRLGSFVAGCVLPFVLVCAWLKEAGVFPQFWFWTISYAREYASIMTLAQGWVNAKYIFTGIFMAAPALWVLAAAGLVLLSSVGMEANKRVFLAGFFIFSFLSVCPGYYFRNHYFILLVPAVALLIGLVPSWGESRLLKARSQSQYLPLAIGALACAQSLYRDRQVLFVLPPLEACRAVYFTNPFPESLEIARYIEQNTRQDERIVVIGSEPQIYFYAHRRSSTGYIYTYPLMEPQPFAKRMQEEMIREIEQNPPAYLVFVSIPTSWLEQTGSSHLLLDWARGYVEQHMQVSGLIQFTGAQTTESAWGADAARTHLHSTLFVSIFKRADIP